MDVEYAFYKDVYGGNKVPMDHWRRISIKAKASLALYTFNRLKEPYGDNVRYALCEMADTIYYDENIGTKTSENNDGLSASYDVSKTIGDKLYKIASVYLMHTGIMSMEADYDIRYNDI
ncbi:MAG: hypothetical protein RSD97_09665 [Lachnospiraceae bacterium]